MYRRPPGTTRPATRFPYPTLVRSVVSIDVRRILGGDDERALRADLCRAPGEWAGRIEIAPGPVAVDVERLGDVILVTIFSAERDLECRLAAELDTTRQVEIVRPLVERRAEGLELGRARRTERRGERIFGAILGLEIGRASCRERCVRTCRYRWSPDH